MAGGSPIPLRFGPPERQLFGIFHPPTGETARAESVVVCNPFGQEAIRAHRLLRIVGERLARAGFPVLRFDFFGTGDSGGADDSGTLALWSEDVLRADLEVRRLSAHPRCAWFGLRLGATVAAVASSRARMAPSRILMWDPILDGKAYLEELFRAQREHLSAAGLTGACDFQGGGATEVLGFPIPAALRREIEAIDGASLIESSRAQRLAVIASEGYPAGVPGEAAGCARVRLRRIGTRIVWASEEAMNTAIVPREALDAILQSLVDVS